MIFQVVAILFVATLVRSTLGFGEALVAVPLLALVIPVKVAAPVAALVSITVAAVVVVQEWRHVQLRSAAWLIASTLAGIPAGLLLLIRVPEPVVKAVLAVVIILFSIQSLRSRDWRLSTDRFAWMFGFVAGVLGGAYGMNGPPLAMYGSMRGWSPGEFRATLQGYFLPASAIGMLGYSAVGLWTASVTRLYLLSLPAVVVAIVIGSRITRRLTPGRFAMAVYAGLVITGSVLLIQAITVL
ncbi:MAG TPA: sulfite exporter TauE/SafE family protein [Vicinamibacterales bacterium]|nr:sulfite exporter TauE/SafE family protein [Vicinamibacterales bacterium]